MRVVYISSSEYPHPTANGVQVVKQCNAFSRAVDDLLLLARLAHGSEEKDDAIRNSYRIEDGVRLHLMRLGRGFPSIINSLLYPFWAAIKTPYGTDCVYGRHLLSLVVVGILKKPRNILFECHAPPRGYLKYVLRVLSRLSTFRQVVAISDALKNLLLARFSYLESNEISVAHDGCDPQPGVEFDRWTLSAGYVGGIYKGRGLDLIIELAAKVSDVNFHVVGGDAKQLRDFTGRDIPANVICHGRVSQAQLSECYENFTVALAPYETAVYTPDGTDTSAYMSPLKIFEYMGWGKVLLASDLPVLREVLTHSENALLVPADDPAAWEAALRSLADEKLARSLASKAHQDAIERFSWDKRANDILKLIISYR